MRINMPGIRDRRDVDRLLTTFFRDHDQEPSFKRAMASISRYYALKPPKVTWFEWLDWGKTGGRCFEDGKIHLVHPENWKRGRKYNSERQWIQTVYHEMGHYVLWADAERKADGFAYKFVRGVSAGARTNGESGRPAANQSRPRRRRRRARSR